MHELEASTPFAESLIWQLQRDYFTKAGIDSWREGDVPHYLTSNPVVGKTYAELVLALLRDRALIGHGTDRVYLLELGAGHGRLCYHFFKHFEKHYETGGIKLPLFTYILSDVAEANLAFFHDHPRLTPYIEAGWLDIAQFDVETDTDIHLQCARSTITQGNLAQPLIVVANYLFDTVSQDLFHIHDGAINRITLGLSTEDDPTDLSPAELIDALQLTHGTEPTTDPVYPDDPQLNTLLEGYRKALDDSCLLLPHTGLRCLDRLGTLSHAGLVLLTADKGEHHLSNLDGLPPPGLVTHGSFSLPVNYHAFRMWAEARGGMALFPRHQQVHLDLGCLLVMPDTAAHVEIQTAYERFIGDYGPDDYFTLKKLIEQHFDTLSFNDIFAVTRLSSFDATIFRQLLPQLIKLAPGLNENQRDSLSLAIPRVWDNHYSLGGKESFAAELGLLLFGIGRPEEAAAYSEQAAALKDT